MEVFYGKTIYRWDIFHYHLWFFDSPGINKNWKLRCSQHLRATNEDLLEPGPWLGIFCEWWLVFTPNFSRDHLPRDGTKMVLIHIHIVLGETTILINAFGRNIVLTAVGSSPFTTQTELCIHPDTWNLQFWSGFIHCGGRRYSASQFPTSQFMAGYL